jgi:MbtH protein
MFDDDDRRRYVVVVNHEEQYSVWPNGRNVPEGWRLAGIEGEITECLTYIRNAWTDMRPLSLQTKMTASTKQPTQG